jgi:hypothetical protein
MTKRQPSWNRLIGFSPLLLATLACGAGAVIVVMGFFSLSNECGLDREFANLLRLWKCDQIAQEWFLDVFYSITIQSPSTQAMN